MIIFIVLASVIVLAIGVVGFLFYMLSKESLEKEKVVPIKDVSQFTKSFITPNETKVSEPLQVPLGNFSLETQQKQIAYEKKMSELEEELQAVQRTHQQSMDEIAAKEGEYQKKSVELEAELQTISQKAQQQSQEALSTIEQLKQENEKLKSEQSNRVTAAEANMIKAQETITGMHEEQGALQNRLSESQAQVQKLQEEVVFIKQQMAKDVVQTKEEIDELSIEKQTLQHSLEAAIAEAAKNFQEEINSLKQENQTLKRATNDLTMANQKLKELNDSAIEKAEVLQWELTKARAQMTSYERACENYQQQLKSSFDRTGSIEQNYAKLNETNNRLQVVLEDLHKQNEELSKREKLFEFDLEKSRTQLVSLERAYENLKATGSDASDSSSQQQ